MGFADDRIQKSILNPSVKINVEIDQAPISKTWFRLSEGLRVKNRAGRRRQNSASWVCQVGQLMVVAGPTVPALRGPLTWGYSNCALPGLGPWCTTAWGWRSSGRGTSDRLWGMASLRTSQRAAMYLVGHGGLPPLAAARSDCIWIHAGALGTLVREVGRSPCGLDWVFVLGKSQNSSFEVGCGAHYFSFWFFL